MAGTAFIGDLNIEPPRCHACGERHEPEYPHEFTERFRRHVRLMHGREATAYDTLAHCKGVIYQASMAAMLKEVAA